MAAIILFPAVLLFSSLDFGRPIAPAGEQADKSAKGSTASLTGCVDEQDGQYVLIHEQTRNLIAHLEAEGFPTEGFAKHLGQKVTVRGTASSNGTNPVFRVRSIQTVSDSCGPQ